MRILMFNYEFPPLGGGAGNATFYLLKEFAKYDDLKIDLITSSHGKYKEKQFANNIKIYYLDIEKNTKLHQQSYRDLLKYSWLSYKFSKKLILKNKYNLIHSFFSIPCGFIAMNLKLPYIVSLRGSDVPFYSKKYYILDKLFFQKLNRKIWKNSKVVISNSKDLRSLALKSSSLQKIEVINNGVNLDEFCLYHKKNNKFIVVSTSRLIRRKGVEYLLDGFIKFTKKFNNSKLLLIGEGNLKKKLVEKVCKENMQNKVEFLGIVKHNKITNYYKKSDVFVLPSLNEGMSNSLLEAMASGLGIIITDTGGTKKLINENNGIIIRKQNSDDIFNALEKIYLDKELLNSMKLSNRKKVEKMSWRNISNKYVKIYKNY